VRTAGGQWVLKLKGIASRDAAEALKGAEVLVDPEQVALPGQDEYFTADLIGCAVVTMANAPVGTVTGVLDTGAQPLLEVRRNGAGDLGDEVLIPLTEDIVKEVQLDRRTIRIDPPPGLLELNSP
jgi:16S rRNA processing protein RimM